MPDYRTIITTTGQTKLAAAILGPALVLQKMAVGDAGGVGYDPAEAQIALVGQVYEANLDSVETLAGGVIVCELTIPADQGGWHVREAAIKDDAGDIIAIARIADRYKPLPASGQADELTIRMKLDVGNVGNVDWVVDLTRKAKIDGQLRPDFRSVEAIQNDPAGAPVAGETWVVGAAPTGAWVGHEGELAEWSGSGWTFVSPTPWMHVGLADRSDWRWDHTLGAPAWVEDLASETVAGRTKLATDAEAALAAGEGVVRAKQLASYIVRPQNDNVTFYLRTDGDDNNDGSANDAAHAYASVQAILARMQDRFNLAGRNVRIVAGNAGTYDTFSMVDIPGSITLEGDTASPLSFVFTGANGITVSKASLRLKGVKVHLATGAVQHNLQVGPSGLVVLDRSVLSGEEQFTWANILVSGGAVNFAPGANQLRANSRAMIRVQDGGLVSCSTGAVIDVTTANNQSSDANIVCVSGGVANLGLATFDGTMLGKRYRAGLNGVINTAGGGANFIPGTIAGTTETGGQYA